MIVQNASLNLILISPIFSTEFNWGEYGETVTHLIPLSFMNTADYFQTWSEALSRIIRKETIRAPAFASVSIIQISIITFFIKNFDSISSTRPDSGLKTDHSKKNSLMLFSDKLVLFLFLHRSLILDQISSDRRFSIYPCFYLNLSDLTSARVRSITSLYYWIINSFNFVFKRT